MRGAHLSMIFQDPMSALNPVMRVGDQIEEAVGAHERLSGARAGGARAIELLERVGIPVPERRMRDYPHQFSGGHAPARPDRDGDRRRGRRCCSPTSRRPRSTS